MRRLAALPERLWGAIAPKHGTLRSESIAGLPRAAAAVPDGMAMAALIGVNPMHGLYAGFAGPIAGGLTASTRRMVITTTSAAALAAASALSGVPPSERVGAMILMTLIAGGIMLAGGIIGLGRFTAFVSHSVMIGFLTGVAVNIILGQLDELTGAEVTGAFPAQSAWRTITQPSAMDVPSLIVGVAALALLWILPATGLRRFAALIALVIPSFAANVIASLESVLTVADIGDIISGIPLPALPDLSLLSLDVVIGAATVAAIVLVQGAGVAESAPNLDRSRTDTNVDFMAQGWGNLASGLFKGIPVGGSVGQTALNIAVGAKDRWASIMSGVWVLVVLLFFSGLADLVAVPTLAAILIVAAVGSLRPSEITAVWRSGPQAQIAIVTTFGATLLLPVAAAVGIGVALSLLLSINREAQDVRLVRLATTGDGRLEERPVPRSLESNTVTVLDVYGSLFYAGARTLEARLPAVGDAERPIVVLRMRGRTVIGATAFSVITRYAASLDDAGGRLYLSGVAPELVTRFRRGSTGTAPISVLEATSVLGESTHAAIAEAEAYLLVEPERVDEPLRPSVANRAVESVRRWKRPGS